MLGTVRIIFDEAVRSGIIANNPMKGIERFPNDAEQREIFRPDELKLLFPTDNESLIRVWDTDMWATFFFIIATTGARLGEIKALAWEDWHTEKGILHIHKAAKNNETIGDTKNEEERVVPVLPKAFELLTNLRSRSFFADDVDLIFCLSREKLLDRKTCATHFKKGFEKAGIEENKRHLTIHCLRHTANTSC